MSGNRSVKRQGTSDDAVPRAPGRPKDLEKRAAIIAAASALFMENGVEAVRMDDVAAAAGVSKMTVYGHFHDKAALFAACLRAASDEMLAGVTKLAERAGTADLETGLVAFGTAFLQLVLNPRIATALHVVMLTLMKHPDLAAAFYDAGPGYAHSALAAVLQAAAARGEIIVDSAVDAAEDLLNLWQGDVARNLALGLTPPLTEADIERRARRGVSVFLRAYGAPARRKPRL